MDEKRSWAICCYRQRGRKAAARRLVLSPES